MPENVETTKEFIKSDQIFYVSADGDSSVLLAIDVKIEGEYISWYDTVKYRTFHVDSQLSSVGGGVIFTSEGRGFNLIPLTLETYRQKVKSNLLKAQEFATQGEMESALRNL